MAFDYKKPFKTVAGRTARLLTDDIEGPFPLAVAIKSGGTETLMRFSKTGRGINGLAQLVNIPERVHRFMNVYADGASGAFTFSRGAAEYNAASGRLGLVELVFEDGKLISFVNHPV